MSFRKILVGLVAGLLCLASLATSAAQEREVSDGNAAASSAPVILVLGDSLSSGYGLATTEAWVSLLQRRLQEMSYPYRVVNASVSGDTTATALTRLGPALARHQPRIVILQLGGNDGLRGLSVNALRSNLASMIEMARGSGAEILLAGMRVPPNYGPDYAQKFERVYVELAAEYDAALIPFFLERVATVAGMMQDDAIHPSITAQPVLLDTVWKYLRPLLKNG